MAAEQEELYVKISRRMHNDASFRRLSRPAPNAQSLWQYLLEGPHVNRIPGLFSRGILSLAEGLKWDVEATRSCLQEILNEELARVDLDAPLIWLPGALHHNKPSSPNVVTGWARDWSQLPECPLREEAAEFFRQRLREIGPTFATAFDGVAPKDRPSRKGTLGSSRKTPPEAFGKTPPEAFPDPFGIQDQDQDQDQKQDPVCGVDLAPDTKRARGNDPQPLPPRQDIETIGPSASLTRDHLSLLLTRYLILRPLLATEHIEHLYLTAFDHKLRFGHAREAISMWHATRAPACKHASAEALLADLGRYFAKAHEHASRSTSDDPDIEPALSMFDELWCKAQKLQSRCRDEGDERRMAHVLKQVKAHAQRVGAQGWRTVLGPVIAAYLVLDDRWLTENSYPVSGLSKRLSRLLEHKPRKPKPAPKPDPIHGLTPEQIEAARRERENFERVILRKPAPVKPLLLQTPPTAPGAPVDPSGSAQAQDGPFPCQESATPICEPDRAARDGPKIGDVVSLMPRLRGGAR